jgi:hypothetical protein
MHNRTRDHAGHSQQAAARAACQGVGRDEGHVHARQHNDAQDHEEEEPELGGFHVHALLKLMAAL